MASAVVDRVGQAVVEGLKRLLAGDGDGDGDGDGSVAPRPPPAQRRRQGSLIAQALSKGLCCTWGLSFLGCLWLGGP